MQDYIFNFKSNCLNIENLYEENLKSQLDYDIKNDSNCVKRAIKR